MTGRVLNVASYVLAGVVAALVGLLPWLITGIRLPLQNLWATDSAPDEMPVALLPFSQYAVDLLAAAIVTGSAVAGLFARATHASGSRSKTVGVVGGVLVVQLVAAAQTIAVVSGGLQSSIPASIYLGALIAGTIVSIAVGLIVLALITRASVPGAVIGLSIAAVALGSWINALVVPVGSLSDGSESAVLSVTRWVPAVVVGLSIAWGGLATVSRIAAAIVGLLALWIGPSLFTAVSAAAGTRALAGYPSELADYGRQVFVSALTAPELSLLPLVVAAVVALIVALAGQSLRFLLRRAYFRKEA